MPMDHATLFHAKSTISLCPPSIQLPGNERWSIANCYTDREMSVISTYLNHNAQTSFGRFVVDILYNQVCNEYSDKSKCIASTVQGARNRGPSSTTLLISIDGVLWRSFSKSTVAHAKMGHVSQITSLLRVICHPFGNS